MTPDSPAHILRQLALDLGVATAEECYAGYLPERSGTTFAMFDVPGLMDGRLHESGETIQHPGVQIRVRADRARTAWQRLEAMLEAFDAVTRRPVTTDAGTWIVLAVTRRSGTFALGPDPEDPRGRHHYTATVTLSLD